MGQNVLRLHLLQTSQPGVARDYNRFVRRHGKVVIGGDGQVSNTVMKARPASTPPIQATKSSPVCRGGTADVHVVRALLKRNWRNTRESGRGAASMAKDWRTILRRLGVLLAVANKDAS
jgi:ATP-dependent protease HslVU (ClpYQ) peptidase subunit